MENEILDADDARVRGFTYSRDEAMRETGWSNSTLGRKMAQMTPGTHYVLVRGKTKPTPVFSRAILSLAGIYEGVAESAETSAEGAELLKPEKEKIPQSSQENLTENLTLEKITTQPNFRSVIEETLLLPFERILNLKQAATESGLSRAVILSAIASGEIKARRLNPQRRVRNGKEFVTGRMQISFISLKKFTAGYLN